MKTQTYQTKEEAIIEADRMVLTSIEGLDFKIIENAIMNGVDDKITHLYKMLTAQSVDGYYVELGYTSVYYNAKANRISHTYTPTTLLNRAFYLINLQSSARKIVGENAKKLLIAQYGRLWFHDGRKFCQLKD